MSTRTGRERAASGLGSVRLLVRYAVGRARGLAATVLDTVPPVRRTVQELVRVEVIDRTLVVAAQALLALVPLVVVLAAFLPADLTSTSMQRFDDVTGLSRASGQRVVGQVEPLKSGDEIRAQTGLVGLVVAVLSSSSFARALMRAYERIWALPSVPGLRGRRRALGWLLGWLVALQLLVLTGWARSQVEARAGEPPVAATFGAVGVAVQVGVAALVWWWTLHVLLSGRVRWRALVVPATVTGAAVVAFSAGSALVMPQYADSSAAQFGTVGLVLAVATWLVAFAGVLVVAAVVGRVLAEDETSRAVLARVAARIRRVVAVRHPDRFAADPAPGSARTRRRPGPGR